MRKRRAGGTDSDEAVWGDTDFDGGDLDRADADGADLDGPAFVGVGPGADSDGSASPDVESGRAGSGSRRRRSRVVLWSAIGAALVFAVLIAVLASAKSAGQGTTQSPLIGKPAPPISGQVLGGTKEVSLSQFTGKWVLVNFSASWCIPCRQETPQLQTFSREHSQQGDAVVLGVAYDEGDISNLTSFLKSSQATWSVVDDGQAVVEYGVSGIPDSFLVDPSGTVVVEYLGGVTSKELDSFIAKATSSA
jgi:cytochrome c biogenesis protein CcmG, thiol:disulfide interchange protein DsbE